MQPRYLILAAIIMCLALAAWYFSGDVFSPLIINQLEEANDDAQIDPAMKKKFARLAVGMTLRKAEEIMGPAGPSYSSQSWREYYIWKQDKTWVSILVEVGKITDLQIRFVP